MAGTSDNNAQTVDDVDDLLQVLIARDIPRLVAKRQIAEALALELGGLRIDFHIAAGARKTRPMRQAMPGELEAQQGGKDLDFLYEVTPPGGITGAVDPQSWESDGVFRLTIRDGHLAIEPRCSLDFPWQAYSFSISHPVVIDHLFSSPTTPASTSSTPTRPTATSSTPTKPAGDAKRIDIGAKTSPAPEMIRGQHKRKQLEAVACEVFPPHGKPAQDGMSRNEAIAKFSGVLKERGLLVDKPKPNISDSTLARTLGYSS